MSVIRLTPIAAAIAGAGYRANRYMREASIEKPTVYDAAKNAEECRKQLARDNQMAALIKAHNKAVQYRARKQKAAVASAAEMDTATAESVMVLEEQYKVMGG